MNRISEMFGLEGKVAVVSGGAGLIGSKVSEILAVAGSDVVIVDANRAACDREVLRIADASGREIAAYNTDITEEVAVVELAKEIRKRFGTPDILVNTAHYKGGEFFHSLGSYPKDTWDSVLGVNLTGTFLMCREIGRMMYEDEGGAIVNFSSTYGVVSADPRIYGESGINSPVAYAATKGGTINLSRYMAIHWRPKVRVNVLVPGGVRAGQDPEFVKNYEYRTPLGRMAESSDYQGAILFMCSGASSYMTGSVVTVDGGWTAW